METVFGISPQSEQELHEVFGPNLKKAALEALALIGYRSGKLSLAQVRRLLGFDNRWQTENWLGEQGVTWNYNLEDLEIDRQAIVRLFPDKEQCDK